MADTPANTRFKPEMPEIPGVSGTPASSKPPRLSPFLLLGIAGLVLALLILVGVRLLSHHRPAEPVKAGPPAQIDVPPRISSFAIPSPEKTSPQRLSACLPALLPNQLLIGLFRVRPSMALANWNMFVTSTSYVRTTVTKPHLIPSLAIPAPVSCSTRSKPPIFLAISGFAAPSSRAATSAPHSA